LIDKYIVCTIKQKSACNGRPKAMLARIQHTLQQRVKDAD